VAALSPNPARSSHFLTRYTSASICNSVLLTLECMQLAAELLHALQECKSALTPFVSAVLDLPRETGVCPRPWKDVLIALASNHACAGALIKVPSLVKPVLQRLVDGHPLRPDDSLLLFKFFAVLHDLAKAQSWLGDCCPVIIKPLLQDLLSKCDVLIGECQN